MALKDIYTNLKEYSLKYIDRLVKFGIIESLNQFHYKFKTSIKIEFSETILKEINKLLKDRNERGGVLLAKIGKNNDATILKVIKIVEEANKSQTPESEFLPNNNEYIVKSWFLEVKENDDPFVPLPFHTHQYHSEEIKRLVSKYQTSEADVLDLGNDCLKLKDNKIFLPSIIFIKNKDNPVVICYGGIVCPEKPQEYILENNMKEFFELAKRLPDFIKISGSLFLSFLLLSKKLSLKTFLTILAELIIHPDISLSFNQSRNYVAELTNKKNYVWIRGYNKSKQTEIYTSVIIE